MRCKESWFEPYELEKMPDLIRIGIIFNQARLKAELLQRELAEATCLTEWQLSQYECGKAKRIPFGARVELAKALHISIFDLLLDDEQGLKDLVVEKESKNNGKY